MMKLCIFKINFVISLNKLKEVKKNMLWMLKNWKINIKFYQKI